MYGSWIKPDRFVNFQDLYSVYMNQLKALAYRFEDIFTGKTERYHEAGIDGYVIEAANIEEVSDYFNVYKMPTAQFIYSISKTATIAANLVPGSVLIKTDHPKYQFIVDNGSGVLKNVDSDIRVGTLNYSTGVYTLDLSDAEVTALGDVVIGYAVVGTSSKAEESTETMSGIDGTVKELKNGVIPGAQAGLTAYIVTISNIRKFFVGFMTNSLENKSKIISKLAGLSTSVSDELGVTPASVSIEAGGSATVTITGGTSPYTASGTKSDVTATVNGRVVTIAIAGGTSVESDTVTITDDDSNTVTVAVAVE